MQLSLVSKCAWEEYSNYYCAVSTITWEPETEIKFGGASEWFRCGFVRLVNLGYVEEKSIE